MASELQGLVDKPVSVITADGRNIVGILKGFDQAVNIILENCQERVFSSSSGMEQEHLGLYIVRGDNIAVIGQVEEEVDQSTDWSTIRGEPLKTVTH